MQLSRALFPLFLISLNAHAAMPELPQVLRHEYACSASLSLRTQAFQPEQERSTCVMLGQIEARFHALFGTANKPVAHDGNRSLRANKFTRVGDYPRYQALAKAWGTSFDAEFALWLKNLQKS